VLRDLGEKKNTQNKAKMPEDVGDTRDEIEEIEEGLNMTEDLAHDGSEEPRLWRNSLLLVCDPFILAKNAAGGINPQAITRFRAECVRSAQVIASGRPIQETLGSSKAIGDFSNEVSMRLSFISAERMKRTLEEATKKRSASKTGRFDTMNMIKM